MALFEVVNTELQLVNPAAGDMEASFGRAALKLIEKGDEKSLAKLMELYEQAKDINRQLDNLLKDKKSKR